MAKVDFPSGKERIRVRAVLSGDQTISNNSDTTVLPNSELFDSHAAYDVGTPTGIFYAPRDGIYLYTFNAQWTANATGWRRISVLFNGATYLQYAGETSPSGSFDEYQEISGLVLLDKGQTLVPRAYQNSGGDLNLQTGNGTGFEMVWMGPKP